MRSLTFLMMRQAKNRLLELKNKPTKLIIYVLAIAFLAWIVITAMGSEMPEGYINPDMFKGILAGFFLFTFLVSLIPAFTQGASLFEMQDANFVFVAPIRPRTVLLYGLVKSAKAILLGSWFIVFQIQWMRSGFGIGLEGVLVAALGYTILAIVCQIITLFVYAFTNSMPRRKRIAKIIIFAVFVPAVGIFLYNLATGSSASEALQIMLASPASDFTPIVGWASAGITNLLLGDVLTGIFFLGLLAASGLAFFMAVFLGNPDYYEDVLGATESVFEATRVAQEEGVTAVSAISFGDKPVKLKGTGINHGAGAGAFFYKHIRESFRCNRLGLWGIMSVLMVAGVVIWSGFVRHSHGAEAYLADREGHLFTVLMALLGIRLFAAGFGRGLLETYNHYIYMVPDRPFSKWVWANMETMFKVFVESAVIFGAVGIIVGVPVWTVLVCIITCVLFTFYLLGINLAFLRLPGASLKAGPLIAIYFVVVLVPLVPGVVAGVFIMLAASEALAMTLALVVFSAWMLLVGIGCFALSKGVLHSSDMPTMKI